MFATSMMPEEKGEGGAGNSAVAHEKRLSESIASKKYVTRRDRSCWMLGSKTRATIRCLALRLAQRLLINAIPYASSARVCFVRTITPLVPLPSLFVRLLPHPDNECTNKLNVSSSRFPSLSRLVNWLSIGAARRTNGKKVAIGYRGSANFFDSIYTQRVPVDSTGTRDTCPFLDTN